MKTKSPAVTPETSQDVARVVYLYNNTLKLAFKEDGHKYEVFHLLDNGEFEQEGREVVGVTTILQNVIAKGALLNWAVKTATDYMLANFKSGKKYDQDEIEALCLAAKRQHIEEKKKAAGTGTDVHAYIEQYVKAKIAHIEPPPLPEDNHVAIKSFLEWEKANDVVWIASEMPIYSRKYDYCGTLDFMAWVNGRKTIGDLKTSNYIYPESYFLQVAGYRFAYEEESGDDSFQDMLIVKIPKTADKKLEVVPVPDYLDNARAFLYGVLLYRQITKLKNIYGFNGH